MLKIFQQEGVNWYPSEPVLDTYSAYFAKLRINVMPPPLLCEKKRRKSMQFIASTKKQQSYQQDIGQQLHQH